MKTLMVDWEGKKVPLLIPDEQCTKHYPIFDEEKAKKMTSEEVRKAYPRFSGVCEACGYSGIAYASFLHYVSGDW